MNSLFDGDLHLLKKYGFDKVIGTSLERYIIWLKIIITIVQLPLAFVRSGYMELNYGRSYVVGNYGYGWSRVSQSATYAYYLLMTPTVVYPSYRDNRWVGFPLRRLYHHSNYP